MMNTRKQVSVIVPVYCAEKYLDSCISSILCQSFTELELILVDDGSPDNSPEICDRYAEKDDRVRVIHQKNGGVSAARNAGINAAQGDYLMFVDSDDTVAENAVEILINDVKQYNADVASAVKSSVFENGEELCKYEDFQTHIFKGTEPLKLSLEYDRQTNSACAKLFSRSFIGDIRFEEGREINEDGFFIFQCYAKQPVLVQHNVAVYRYCVHESSSSRRDFSEKYFDMIYFADKKMDLIKENYPELMPSARNMEVSTHLFFLEVLCRADSSEYESAKRDSIRTVRRNYSRYTTNNRHEKMMAAIVRYGLYTLYRFVWRIKFGRRARS